MCGCSRVTYLCSCRHKERIIERCLIYQLRQNRSCWAICFPRCKAKTERHRLQRVCGECHKHFLEKYGPEHYEKFIQYFLEYKEKNKLARVAIDPQSVPRKLLLNRQSAPTILGTQPFPIHAPMISASKAPDDHRAKRLPSPPKVDDADYDGQVATATRVKLAASRAVRCNSPPSSERDIPLVSSTYIPRVGDPPLCADASLFAVGDDEDDAGDGECNSNHSNPGTPVSQRSSNNVGRGSNKEVSDGDDEGCEKQRRVLTPSPPAKYDSRNLPPNLTIIPELAHLDPGRAKTKGRSPSPELQHPRPSVFKNLKETKAIYSVDRLSDISLVKRLTEKAEHMHIDNIEYFEFNGKLVPRVMTPPRGSRPMHTTPPEPFRLSKSLPPTPPSEDFMLGTYTDDVICASPEPIEPRQAEARQEKRLPTPPESCSPDHYHNSKPLPAVASSSSSENPPRSYFVATTHDQASPTGVSALVRASPSHQTIIVPPPQRLNGVLIPAAEDCPYHHKNKAIHQGGEDDGNGGSNADCPRCRGTFFKERGLPSESFIMHEESRSAGLVAAATSSPMLVSVKVPRRRYTCASQSCYCAELAEQRQQQQQKQQQQNGTGIAIGNGDGYEEKKKCPSCRAREAISKDLNITWI